jgi:hypothetical protein
LSINQLLRRLRDQLRPLARAAFGAENLVATMNGTLMALPRRG